jgi:hypothetical protein
MEEQLRQSASIQGISASVQPGSREARYLRVVRELVDDAYSNRTLHLLTPVLSWALAGIGHDFGTGVCGEILVRLGNDLRRFEEQRRAQNDADAAKQAGLKPQ